MTMIYECLLCEEICSAGKLKFPQICSLCYWSDAIMFNGKRLVLRMGQGFMVIG